MSALLCSGNQFLELGVCRIGIIVRHPDFAYHYIPSVLFIQGGYVVYAFPYASCGSVRIEGKSDDVIVHTVVLQSPEHAGPSVYVVPLVHVDNGPGIRIYGFHSLAACFCQCGVVFRVIPYASAAVFKIDPAVVTVRA